MVDYLEELGEGLGEQAPDGPAVARAPSAASSAPDAPTRQRLRRAFELMASQEELLAERLLSYLNQRKDVRIIGHDIADRTLRVPTISFVVDGRDSAEIATSVDCFGIGIRSGDFYARRLIQALGLEAQNGVVRVSMVHYNTLDEVDHLIKAFDEVLG